MGGLRGKVLQENLGIELYLAPHIFIKDKFRFNKVAKELSANGSPLVKTFECESTYLQQQLQMQTDWCGKLLPLAFNELGTRFAPALPPSVADFG